MTDVFVSHVEEDSAAALEVADALEAAGYSTWCYERDSIPGPSYLVQTGTAVEESRALVVLISRHSLGSRQVTVEVVRGHETGKPFIPVLVGLTHVEFAARQPEWREAIGAATSIMVPREGVGAVAGRIVAGLHALGIEPSGVVPEHRVPTAPGRMPVRGPVGAVRSLPRRQQVALAAVAGVVVLALAVLVVVRLTATDRPAATTGGGTPTAAASGPRLTTSAGEALVSGAILADEFCPPANFPGACDRPASGRFLVVTLTGADGGRLTIAVTQQSHDSYVSHDGQRYRAATMADEYGGVVRLVYEGAPVSLAGQDVTLVWPGNTGVTVHVAE